MKRLNFSEFTDAVVGKIKEFLPETYENATIDIQTVLKNNDLKLTGLNIRCVDKNICPTIYLESFFRRYEEGEALEKILVSIADLRVSSEAKKFDINHITDFDRVRDSIVPRLCGEKWNEELLAKRPHKIIEDLAITYHITLEHEFEGMASVAVSNYMLDIWNMNVDQLHEIAIKNLPKSTFQSMFSVMREIMLKNRDEEDVDDYFDNLDFEDNKMFVLSNESKMYGATALLDKEIMQKIIEKMGDNFYIIPSSIHELIIVDGNNVSASGLKSMIEEVNDMSVSVEERLSDHPYRYSLEEGLFSA